MHPHHTGHAGRHKERHSAPNGARTPMVSASADQQETVCPSDQQKKIVDLTLKYIRALDYNTRIGKTAKEAEADANSRLDSITDINDGELTLDADSWPEVTEPNAASSEPAPQAKPEEVKAAVEIAHSRVKDIARRLQEYDAIDQKTKSIVLEATPATMEDVGNEMKTILAGMQQTCSAQAGDKHRKRS